MVTAVQTVENLQGSVGHTTKKGKLFRRYKQLETDRSSWRSHFMELSDYLLPRRGRFLLESQSSKGRKRNNKIINNAGGRALRTMAAGMMSGMTSPARPWFRYQTADPDLMEQHEVKVWLGQAEKAVRTLFNRSNFYNSIHTMYFELGAFGTGAVYRQPSVRTIVNYRTFTAGEFVIAEDDEGVVDTLGREFQMTVSQVVEAFLADPFDRMRVDWSKASKAIKNLWDRGQYDNLIPVIHMIEPRRRGEFNPFKGDAKNRRYLDAYVEIGGEGDVLLREGGSDRFPAYCPRWDVTPSEVYGRSPGMETLGDIKQLQMEEKRKAQAIDKMVNPPMTAPVSLKGKPTTVLPGGTTYVDVPNGGQGFAPAYLVQPRIAELTQDIQMVTERIEEGFYADLFKMMIASDRRQITATEVVERHEEKLVLLGPVLQRLNSEAFDPIIEDAFIFAMEANMIDPPPPILHETEMEIKYVSLLAQAQEAVAASVIERALGFAGNMAAVWPSVADNIDEDAAFVEYAEILGTSPEILRSSDAVKKIRKQRDEAQQAEQQMAMAGQAAQSAKVLSETDTQAPNALTNILGGVGP